jgi:hypothetical protein
MPSLARTPTTPKIPSQAVWEVLQEPTVQDILTNKHQVPQIVQMRAKSRAARKLDVAHPERLSIREKVQRFSVLLGEPGVPAFPEESE